ncbi:hypothetical protein Gohar_008563 [Gossypium harknessii]|uniref:Protein kinase domain-containing protein n=1 Tax=Gossypium harknessii TaxID=34285 RepID=A0A7J9GK16_9ROSI|nr:hypothetical protein [Gossypium harknessii]
MDSHTRLSPNILVLLVMAVTFIPVTRAQVFAKNGCPTHCGDLTIPYPFGTMEGCYLNKNFYIKCTETADSFKAYLAYTDFIVTDITMEGQLQILTTVARDCYSAPRLPVMTIRQIISLSPFSIYNVSNTRNKFTAIGCDTYAYLYGFVGNKSYRAGCMSLCNRFEDLVDGSCSGFGCCQIQIPDGLKTIDVVAYSFNRHVNVSDFNPCSYAFIVEESRFRFSSGYVQYISEDYKFPVSLDWVVSNETCVEAAKNPSNYACHRSECHEPDTGSGYLCKCPDGFYGNPYLPEGCLDMDECKIWSPCHKNAICSNLPGSFNCICKGGYEGDGKRNGTGCSPVDAPDGFPFHFLDILGTLAKKAYQAKRKFLPTKWWNYLTTRIFKKLKGSVSAKIFTSEELKKATNNFHETRILGKGGHGTVYKGILQDNRVVAIKKSMIVDHSQVEQFVNEVIILSQVNHRNVVKLLGCCLETEVPLLVYEFISNGTLHQSLHCSGKGYLSWECRLRIAVETAGALSYLHSAAYPPIIHRDVKSTNILLDEHYTAKVSDFGASSDVYSFGVVLAELLTKRKALCFQMPEEERNLAMHFVSALKKDQLFGIIDHQVLVEGNTTQIKEVAMLANKCLRVRGEERPSMKEVEMELEGLRSNPKHPWVKDESKEIEYLLSEPSGANAQGNDGSPSDYDSGRQQIILQGR